MGDEAWEAGAKGLEDELKKILEEGDSAATPRGQRASGQPTGLVPYPRAGRLVRPDELVQEAALAELQRRRVRMEEFVQEATEEEALKLQAGVAAIQRMQRSLGAFGLSGGDCIAQEVVTRLFEKGVQRIGDILERSLYEEGEDDGLRG